LSIFIEIATTNSRAQHVGKLAFFCRVNEWLDPLHAILFQGFMPQFHLQSIERLCFPLPFLA